MTGQQDQWLLLETLSQTAIIFFLASLALILFWKLLNGHINLQGLFVDNTTGTFSPVRVQLLLVTLIESGGYLIEIVESSNASTLPVPSDMMLGAVAGSQLLYLGGKSSSFIGSLLKKYFRK